MDLKAFIDVDWAGSVIDKKSTSGGAFFLGKRLVSWTSKKKNLHLSIHSKGRICRNSSQLFEHYLVQTTVGRNEDRDQRSSSHIL